MGVAVVDPTTSPRGFGLRARARADGVAAAPRAAVPAPARRGAVRAAHAARGSRTPTSTSTTTCAAPRCPAPGGEPELAAFVADVAGRPLDRRHPLWEAWVVEGLEHGHYAFVVKIHHSLIDGASGVEILAALFDLEPEPEPKVADIAPDWEPEHVPSDLEMLEPLPRSRSRSARCCSSRPPTTSAAASVRGRATRA